MYGIATDVPETAGAGTYCLSLPGIVTITNVALHKPYGDIRIDAFAFRPNPAGTGVDLVGNNTTLLADMTGFYPASTQIVDSQCPPAHYADEYELALQLTRYSGTLGGAFSLDITYRSGTETHTLTAPYGLWLCSGTQPASGNSDWTLDSGLPPPC